MVLQRTEEERAKSLRAGLIAAAIYNVNLPRGSRKLKSTDFVSMPDDYLTPEMAQSEMDGWAKSLGAVEGAPLAPVDVDAERRKALE